jgi:hypothetical protein
MTNTVQKLRVRNRSEVSLQVQRTSMAVKG